MLPRNPYEVTMEATSEFTMEELSQVFEERESELVSILNDMYSCLADKTALKESDANLVIPEEKDKQVKVYSIVG